MPAQRQAVETYLNGCGWKLLGEEHDVETGKHAARPGLQRALGLCRKHKATLVIAKLDRLSRNLHFISGLMESKAKFVACDMPNARDFELHIIDPLAQAPAQQPSALPSAEGNGDQPPLVESLLNALNALVDRISHLEAQVESEPKQKT